MRLKQTMIGRRKKGETDKLYSHSSTSTLPMLFEPRFISFKGAVGAGLAICLSPSFFHWAVIIRSDLKSDRKMHHPQYWGSSSSLFRPSLNCGLFENKAYMQCLSDVLRFSTRFKITNSSQLLELLEACQFIQCQSPLLPLISAEVFRL